MSRRIELVLVEDKDCETCGQADGTKTIRSTLIAYEPTTRDFRSQDDETFRTAAAGARTGVDVHWAGTVNRYAFRPRRAGE